ncbi:SNARE associated golgi protein [Clostridium aceticum]|uniref:TVP38/TMEM64 family membrane protein n=2 Tax=Clostridium aceticum TaxID=84022 RepID=A0A0G3W5D0_9CLOT|nr:SNARE associated golgi protein [Clostridium aceticum]
MVIGVAAIFITILTLIFPKENFISLASQWDIEKLQDVVEDFGAWGILVFIGIASLKPFLFFPNAFIFIVGGLVYGTILGSIASLTGIMIAFSLCYWLGGRFHHVFMRFVGRKHVIKLQSLKDEEIIRVLFTMRVTPGFPIDAISYGAGLAGIPYNKFVLGSLLGVAPKIVLYTFLGDNINDIFSLQAIIAYISLLLLAILPTWLHKRSDKTQR